MGKIYQPARHGHILPTCLYNQTIWAIRSADQLRTELATIGLPSSPAGRLDGMPRGTGTGDPTYKAATRRAEADRIISAVDEALEEIPAEYRRGVYENVVKRWQFPRDAARSTYSRHKQMFVYSVARNLDWA